PQTFELEVVAFAHDASFFATREEFEAGQREYWARPGEPDPVDPEGRPLRLAEVCFMPEGSFAPHGNLGERAVALFTGRVETSEKLVNRATGAEFLLARIETLPGPVNTVIDPAACKGVPTVGSMAMIRAWLVGRPNVPPPSAKRSWFAKLFSK